MTMLIFGAVFFHLLYMPGDPDGTDPQMDAQNRADGTDKNRGMAFFQLHSQLFRLGIVLEMVDDYLPGFRRHQLFQCPEFYMIAAQRTCGDEEA